jgi:hypothetical protein
VAITPKVVGPAFGLMLSTVRVALDGPAEELTRGDRPGRDRRHLGSRDEVRVSSIHFAKDCFRARCRAALALVDRTVAIGEWVEPGLATSPARSSVS